MGWPLGYLLIDLSRFDSHSNAIESNAVNTVLLRSVVGETGLIFILFLGFRRPSGPYFFAGTRWILTNVIRIGFN